MRDRLPTPANRAVDSMASPGYVNEREENIEDAVVITELLRFPNDPVRRWFDRRILRDVVKEVRAVNSQV
ncbi:hypothetical protein K7H21_28305 (plasmid) [Klebsiella sp. CTHL.F3a]|nr:hypothetical protein K7H21_28305 [Klebsiella sp. CTHL.F3a]